MTNEESRVTRDSKKPSKLGHGNGEESSKKFHNKILYKFLLNLNLISRNNSFNITLACQILKLLIITC